MRFFIQTFGCKSNQYESQAIRESLVASGFIESLDPDSAQILIHNSCAVTSRAGASCRNAIRKALRANPGLKLVLTGCAVDVGEQWLSEFTARHVVPNGQKHAIADLLVQDIENGPPPDQIADEPFALAISRFHGHTRAFLKIQDGCDNHCAYCVVPLARGRARSRPPGDILREAARLVENGHPEIALTGINIGAYDHEGLTLAGLILRLAETPGLVRLRLGSIEPQEVTEELLSAMRGHDKICPHIHLPLQSGDDAVLAQMRRRYTPDEYLQKVDLIRRHLDRPAITADVIVGFPGEDAAAFEKTHGLCRRADFSRLHVFLFSPRPGTPAANMRRAAHDRAIDEWKNRLIELGDKQAEAFAASCLGTVERAVVETDGCLTDRYLKAHVGGSALESGATISLRITGIRGGELEAEPA